MAFKKRFQILSNKCNMSGYSVRQIFMSYIVVIFMGLGLASCTHFNISMHNYSDLYTSTAEGCNINVFDDRPASRIVAGISYEVTPPINEIMSLKLCNSNFVKEYSLKHGGIKIHINEIRVERIQGPFYYEYIGHIYAKSDEYNFKKIFHGYASTFQQFFELATTANQRLIDLLTTDLASKIENHLKENTKDRPLF
jgi:hypothetical protein